MATTASRNSLGDSLALYSRSPSDTSATMLDEETRAAEAAYVAVHGILKRKHDLTTSEELENENVYFHISETVISAFEQARRLRLSKDKLESLNPDNQTMRVRSRTMSVLSNASQAAGSPRRSWRATSERSTASDLDVTRDDDTSSEASTPQSIAESLLPQLSSRPPIDVKQYEPMVTDRDAPNQRPLPKLPVTLAGQFIAPDQPAIRGNERWAPPRNQIIFQIRPRPPSKRRALEKQNYQCCECGVVYDVDKISTFRFCNYFGKYFCSRCSHLCARRVLPASLLQHWSKTPEEVSDKAARLLDEIQDTPLFDICAAASEKTLSRSDVKDVLRLRRKLQTMSAYIKLCRESQDLAARLTDPPHLCTDPSLFTLNELLQLRNKELKPKLEALVKTCAKHIEKCPRCRDRGFVCELCGRDDDIIFAFQSRSYKCPDCKTVLHDSCFRRAAGGCPKCARLNARQRSRSFHSVQSESTVSQGSRTSSWSSATRPNLQQLNAAQTQPP